MLVHIVNSQNIYADKITMKYFEPGHTFMSADSVHHAIEKAMTKMGKVYDFNDFVECVENAKCTPQTMTHKDFRNLT